MPLHLAVVIAGVVSWAAWCLRALTTSGAFAGWAVGAAVLWGTGLPGGLVLAAFFAPTSAVSRLTERWTPPWVDAKGNQRDAAQVLANGGVALAGGLAGRAALDGGLWLLTGALAAAAADSWATAVGALSRRDPVLIVSGRRVPKGTSGGVSLAGSLGGILGAAIVAGAAGLATGAPALVGTALLAGTFGTVADSVLGATVQGRYRCPACAVASERRRHRCGTATTRVGGIRWVDNDVVNTAATALAGLGAFGAWLWA